MKFKISNPSDTDLVFAPEDLEKMAYNPSKYLKTNKEFEDDIIEEGMLDFFERRRKSAKRGPGNREGRNRYAKVKGFDVDQYRTDGQGKIYGRRGPGFGDVIEDKYTDAEYLGFSNVDGNIRPLDYLTRGPGFVTVDGDTGTFIRQDFEGSNTEFDRTDDSEEWQRSMRNPMNQPIRLMPRIGPSQIPVNNDPPELMRSNQLPQAQGGTGTGITYTPGAQGGYNAFGNRPLPFSAGNEDPLFGYNNSNLNANSSVQAPQNELNMQASLYASSQAMLICKIR